MAQEISIQDLERKQAEMVTLASQIAAEKDAAKAKIMTANLQRQSEEVQRMARALEEQEKLKHGAERVGAEVLLTEEQQKRIEARTGIKIESVKLSPEEEAASSSNPQVVEDCAMKEALRRRQAADSEAKMRLQVEQVLAQIAAASPAAASQISELKADPNFMGGLLAKRK